MRFVPTKPIRLEGECRGTGSKPSKAIRTIPYMIDRYRSSATDGPVEDVAGTASTRVAESDGSTGR